MRMWMVDPELMCDRHLLGEHAETHMLAGTLARKRSIAGFIEKGLLEPASLARRHDELVAEMTSRGFRHVSALPEVDPGYLPERERTHRVDAAGALRDLVGRCERCRARSAGRP